jgi:hypothetical protein
MARDKIERPCLYPSETVAIDNKPGEPPTPTSILPLMYPKLIKIDLPITKI